MKVNYQTVKDVAEAAKSMAGGIDNIRTGIKNLDNAITACAGKSITVLEERTPELDKKLEGLGDGLNQLGDIFNEFAENMLGIISYGDAGIDSMVHINTVQVKNSLARMAGVVVNLEAYARSKNPSVGEGLSMSRPLFVSDADKNSISQINSNLDAIKDMVLECASYIKQYEDDFEKMRQEVIDYENMDDTMKAKIKDLYEVLADIDWWETTTFKFVVGAALIVAAVAFIAFVPAAAGVAAFVAGVAKSVVAYGALNTTINLISSYVSGDDIEDAVATGMFEGAIEGILVGGASEAGKVIGGVVSKTNAGQSLMAKKNISKKTMEEFFGFNVEYVGQVSNSVFKQVYNGQEVNMRDTALKEAVKHSWKAMDKVAMRDINAIFAGKEEAIKEGVGDVTNKLFANKSLQKLSQYGAKSGIYFADIGTDSFMKEFNSSNINDESMSLSDIYDSVTGKYDSTKLFKYIIKDDFKDIVKKQVGKLAPKVK